MDLAKGAWILYERPDLTDLGLVSPLDKLNLRQRAILAAVPTTAGTGSECTAMAVFQDTAVNRKIVVAHDELVPDVAILSPGFTLTMPPDPRMTNGAPRFMECSCCHEGISSSIWSITVL